VNLGVEDLPDCDQGEWSCEVSCGTTCNGTDEGFLSGSEIVGGLDWLGVVVNDFVEGISNDQIAESAD